MGYEGTESTHGIQPASGLLEIAFAASSHSRNRTLGGSHPGGSHPVPLKTTEKMVGKPNEQVKHAHLKRCGVLRMVCTGPTPISGVCVHSPKVTWHCLGWFIHFSVWVPCGQLMSKDTLCVFLLKRNSAREMNCFVLIEFAQIYTAKGSILRTKF